MKWSAFEVVEVPPGVVTVTSTVPALPAGAVAVICVAPFTVKLVAAVPPKLTAVAPVSAVPVIVTLVPPDSGPAFGAMLACLIMLETGSAVAAVNPVLRNLTKQTFTGQCCVSFDEEVSITEPSALKPVVVTWDTGYEINAADDYIAGLSVNGGACQASSAGGVFGAELIPDYQLASGKFSHISFQWIILPSDGVLVAGKNTFVLCGGGLSFSSDSISILDNTLFAQLVK